ncbi:DUF6931 family protein [Posidoniimonas corsicana]
MLPPPSANSDLPPADAIGELADDICVTSTAAGPWPARLVNESADAYFARLVESGELDAAVRFAAVRMGPRRATWWGSMCVWNTLRDQPDASPNAAAAVDAAVQWVLTRTEDSRRAAREAADAVGMQTPSGAVAASAFWSEGSVSLVGCPDVPAPPGVAAKLVVNAVTMTAAAPASAERTAALLQSLRIAAEVLATPSPWSAVAVEESPA